MTQSNEAPPPGAASGSNGSPETTSNGRTRGGIGGGVVIIAILIGRSIRRRRLLCARAEPGPDAPRRSFEELKADLLALCSPESPFVAHMENQHFLVTWQLHGIPWATLLFRRKLRETQALELMSGGPDGRSILVRYRAGSIEWETAAATWMPKAKVKWSHPRSYDSGPPHDPADRPAAPSAESPRTFSELVRHVRPIVLRNGFRFEPVLDFPTARS